MKTAFIYTEDFLKFDYGTAHPLRIFRLKLTYELIKDQFEFEDGQMVNCKGLGDIMTYLLLRRR